MSTTIIKFTPEVEAPVVPVAPDLSGSENFSVPPTVITLTPVITEDGSPVTADSLTITEGPSNGTAVVVGLTLQYTPNSGYAGPDAFSYLATVGGVESNIATVTITVNVIALGRPIQKQNRLIAYLHDDTVVDCYARTDTGAMDVTGYDLTAHIRPYNGRQPLGQDYGVGWPGIYVPFHTELPAQQIEVGHIQFTLDHGTIHQRLGPGLFRLYITAQNPVTLAKTRVYTALLTLQ